MWVIITFNTPIYIILYYHVLIYRHFGPKRIAIYNNMLFYLKRTRSSRFVESYNNHIILYYVDMYIVYVYILLYIIQTY